MDSVTRFQVSFNVPGEPTGKARPRVVRNGAFARTYTPEKTVNYENLIKVEYQRQCGNTYFGEACLAMEIVAFYGLPSSASKRKKAAMLEGVLRPKKKPDCDNVVKVICDALNGVAYHDDAQVVSCSIDKRYANIPHIEIKINEV